MESTPSLIQSGQEEVHEPVRGEGAGNVSTAGAFRRGVVSCRRQWDETPLSQTPFANREGAVVLVKERAIDEVGCGHHVPGKEAFLPEEYPSVQPEPGFDEPNDIPCGLVVALFQYLKVLLSEDGLGTKVHGDHGFGNRRGKHGRRSPAVAVEIEFPEEGEEWEPKSTAHHDEPAQILNKGFVDHDCTCHVREGGEGQQGDLSRGVLG